MNEESEDKSAVINSIKVDIEAMPSSMGVDASQLIPIFQETSPWPNEELINGLAKLMNDIMSNLEKSFRG